jgi:arsenate reductase (thioredoxin)
MAEAGVDISRQQSTTIDELPFQQFDWVITLCGHANESCTFFPGMKVHNGFDDPPKLALQAKDEEEKMGDYRRVRDEIRDFIASLPEHFELCKNGIEAIKLGKADFSSHRWTSIK